MVRSSLLSAALLAGCAAPPPAPQAAQAQPELIVLGIAQDGGVPHLGCERSCCANARRDGLHMGPASLGVSDPRAGKLLLVEATPAVEAQLATLHAATGAQRGRSPVDAVLLTHAHIGHYLGLAQFGREVAATAGLPVHVSPRMAAFLRGHGPWQQLVELAQIELRELTPGEWFEPWPGLSVRAIPVPHRDEFSDTMAFVLRGPRRSVLFVPDIDRFTAQSLQELLQGVDVAYVDGTFYDGRELPGRDLREIPHPPIVTTMDLLAEHARVHPGSIRFIHLNHTNPALWDPGVRADIERRGFRIATEGERVGL